MIKWVNREKLLNLENGRLIGLDIGRKKVGIAISDRSRTVARGLKTVAFAQLTKELKEVISQNAPIAALVLGMPVSKSGEAEKRMKGLGNKLQNELKLPIFFENERLTSWEARERLKEQGYKDTEIEKLEDQVAAQLILQSFLNGLPSEDAEG